MPKRRRARDTAASDANVVVRSTQLGDNEIKSSFLYADGRNAAGQFVYRTSTCAICLDDIKDPKAGVRLTCGHAFHGTCVVQHLQRDRRCPTCRQAPTSRREVASEEDEDSSSSDAEEDDSEEDVTEVCTQRLLMGFTLEMLNDALVRYGGSAMRSRRRAAVLLAEKLTCDSEDDDE